MNEKKLFNLTFFIGLSILVFYLALFFITVLYVESETILSIIIVLSTVLFIISLYLLFTIEINVGYYECKDCHHKFKPSYKTALLAFHVGFTRYLKCPECNKKSWLKKKID